MAIWSWELRVAPIVIAAGIASAIGLSIWAAASAAEQPQIGVRVGAPDDDVEATRQCGLTSSAQIAFDPRGTTACPLYTSNLAGYDADTNTTVDLMVVYTSAAQTAAGGQVQIESRIDTAVAFTNQAYANSQITPRIRVVRKALIAYTESGVGITDLDRLVATSDGFLDSVHADRDTYGADLVSLWVSTLDAGGVAYQPSSLWPTEDGRNTFSVVRQNTYNTDTLAHELGHNFGCQHDRQNLSGVGFFPYSYGYREPGALWHDIMAYPPGTPIQYFSNPNINYNGPPGNPGPLGVPGEDANSSCDCSRTHNELAFTVANFRPRTISPAPAARLYVRATAPGGGSGATWGTAINSLKQAMLTAVRARGAVTEIWVAAGTYKPDLGTNDRLRSFRLPRNVSVYGGFAGTETLLFQRNVAANPTILSGDIGVSGNASDNSYHVVNGDGLDSTSVLDGFTITGGNANGADPHNAGGGVHVACGSPTFRNCTIIGNTATVGGGAEISNGSAPLFEVCSFLANSAVDAGGIRCSGGSPTMNVCTIQSNTGGFSAGMQVLFGGAPVMASCTFFGNLGTDGGGLGVYFSSPILVGCVFNSNSASGGGGGVLEVGCSTILIECAFDGNTAPYGAGLYRTGDGAAEIDTCTFNSNFAAESGGAIYLYDTDPTIVDCAFNANFVGSEKNGTGAGGAMTAAGGSAPLVSECAMTANSAGCCGGAVYLEGSPAIFDRCTWTENYANYGAGIWLNSAASAQIENSLFWGNFAGFSGGALHTSGGATPTIGGCVFSGNVANNGFGGVSYALSGSGPAFRNCTLSRNSATFTGGGLYSDASTTTVTNSLLWQNSDGSGQTQSAQITNVSGAVTTVNYSSVQGWNGALGGSGNNGTNPQFRDSDGPDDFVGSFDDDLRLLIASAGIDSGRNSDVPVWLTTDADGNARFSNTGCKADTGVGTPPIVDRGAYEYASTAVPGDMDSSGAVAAPDLLPFVNVMIKVNLDPQQIGAADVNCDGRTDGDDVRVFVTDLLT